ncbi:MAG: response regulator transcription factor [Asticcacaulis sp.]|uniref:response regulator transcription factor n=1 Tax=Asticcacaulis sp. TaxID=1872648 RepID=UPI003F7C9DD3
MSKQAGTSKSGAAGLQALTPRQRQVLRLYSQHKTAKVIALELGLGVHTVNDHLAEIRTRLGVTTTKAAALMLLASESGPAPPNESGAKPMGIAASSSLAAGDGHGNRRAFEPDATLPGLVGPGDSDDVSGDALQAGRCAGDPGFPETARTDRSASGDGVHLSGRDRLGGKRGLALYRRLKRFTLVEWTGVTLVTMFVVVLVTLGVVGGLAGILDLIQQLGDRAG